MKRRYFKFIAVSMGILLSSMNVYAVESSSDKSVRTEVIKNYSENKDNTEIVTDTSSKKEKLDTSVAKDNVKGEKIDEERNAETGEINGGISTSTNEKKAESEISNIPEKKETNNDDDSDTSTTTDYYKDEDSKENSEVENTSIDKAKDLNINTVEYGKMSKEAEIRWYLTYIPKGKMTLNLTYKAETAIKLNLHLYKFDLETKEISEVANSKYSDGALEQLSYIADEGYYFIAVNSVSGFNANNQFAIALTYSDTYDNYEANDNFNNSTVIPEKQSSILGSIDNDFDIDWYQITVSEKKPVYISLNNDNKEMSYSLDVYDASFNLLTTINQNQYATATLPEGKYYLKIGSSKGHDSASSYLVRFILYDDISTAKPVSKIPIDIKDSIDNELDCNWNYFKINSSIMFDGQISNRSNKCKCKLEIYKLTDDSKLQLLFTLNQNQYNNFTLDAGIYFMKVSAVEGYDPDVQYNIYLYQYQPNIDIRVNELYIDGRKVTLYYQDKWDSPVSRARYDIQYDANNEYCKIESAKYIGDAYKGVKHGVLVTVNHCIYSNWQTIWNEDHWETPFINEYVDGVMFLVDADTGKCVTASL